MYLADLQAQSLFILLMAAVTGAVIGSFLTLLTHRLPLEKPVVATRSKCPSCKKNLTVIDLIPIFSWAAFLGKCRFCKASIGLRYPLTELACAIGATVVVHVYGVTLEALALVGLWWAIVAIILTDLEHYIILDEVQIATALLGLLYAYVHRTPFSTVLLAGLAGLLIGAALKYGFLMIAKKEGLGMGDVKFLGVAGIWLEQAEHFVPFLFFSGVLGIVLGLIWRGLGQGDRFPFGPALAAALLLSVVWPQAAEGFWQLYGVGR